MQDLLLELGLALLVLGVFLAFVAWLNRLGYKKSVAALSEIARKYGWQLINAPAAGSIWQKSAAANPIFEGSSSQYAHLEGHLGNYRASLHSIRRRRGRFFTRISLYRNSSDTAENEGDFILALPRDLSEQQRPENWEQLLPYRTEIGEVDGHYEWRCSSIEFAQKMLTREFCALFFRHKGYFRGRFYLSQIRAYSEEAALIVNPPDIQAAYARIDALMRVARAGWL